MKDENKNQDEVKILKFYFDKDNKSNGIPFPIWKDEHAGDRETLKEICNILRRGAELLSGYEVAEEFCNFVKKHCYLQEEHGDLWDEVNVSASTVDWLTFYLKDLWLLLNLNKSNTKPLEIVKEMLRELYIYMEKKNGFSTRNFRELLLEAGVME